MDTLPNGIPRFLGKIKNAKNEVTAKLNRDLVIREKPTSWRRSITEEIELHTRGAPTASR